MIAIRKFTNLIILKPLEPISVQVLGNHSKPLKLINLFHIHNLLWLQPIKPFTFNLVLTLFLLFLLGVRLQETLLHELLALHSDGLIDITEHIVTKVGNLRWVIASRRKVMRGPIQILRETSTSSIVRFKAGSVEPAHHHTFGHDLVVMEGKKSVWNLSKKEWYDLGVVDFLFTLARDVHRVKYYEDIKFFIKWDGKWDMFFDEDLKTAKATI